MSRAYLDWNATTPPLLEVQHAMRDAARDAWANPSSIHADGRRAREVIEDARASIAALTGTDARDIVFTSGGTEANNLALRSLTSPNTTLITSRIEHPSVTKVAEALEREGRAHVHWLHVTRDGVIDLEDLDRALNLHKVSLVTVQAVNHETGVIQPVREVIDLAKAKGARVHVDAVQGWGKVLVPSGWDTASVGPHKMRGPKGIGALASRQGVRIESLLLGGSQEKGIRPGTVDASLAAGFGVAARVATTSPDRWAKLAPLRDELEKSLLEILDDHDVAKHPRVVGDPTKRAPHVSNLIWPGWIGAELVAALDLEGVSVSSGAACSAGTVEPSPVLLAMIGPSDAARGVRMTIGDATTHEEITHALRAFRAVLPR
jgi:cysteine desulfurase